MHQYNTVAHTRLVQPVLAITLAELDALRREDDGVWPCVLAPSVAHRSVSVGPARGSAGFVGCVDGHRGDDMTDRRRLADNGRQLTWTLGDVECQTSPSATIAWLTRRNPTMFAPTT